MTFKSHFKSNQYILISLALYFVAKVFEHYDLEVYNITNKMISGHVIKHLVAALSSYCIFLHLKTRELKTSQ